MKNVILLTLSLFLLGTCLAFGKTASEVEKNPLCTVYKIKETPNFTLANVDLNCAVSNLESLSFADVSPGLPSAIMYSKANIKITAKHCLRYCIQPLSKYRAVRQKGIVYTKSRFLFNHQKVFKDNS